MKNKINSVMIFCFILNSFAVFGGISSYTSKIYFKNSDNLSPILRLFSTTIIPVSIVNNFVVEETPVASAYKDNSKTHNRNRGNSTLDCTFIITGKPTKLAKIPDNIREHIQIDISYFLSASIKKLENDWPPGKNNFVYLFILTYLVLLLKSNLPWLSTYIKLINKTQPKIIRLGFLFDNSFRCHSCPRLREGKLRQESIHYSLYCRFLIKSFRNDSLRHFHFFWNQLVDMNVSFIKLSIYGRKNHV